jgi:hypothetical protein
MAYPIAACRPKTLKPGASVNPLRISDSFTAANGTTLAARAPDIVNTPGNTWQVTDGTWDIQGNQGNPATFAASLAKMTIDAGQKDGIALVTWKAGQTTGDSDFVQFLFRYVDANNFWCLTAGLVTGVHTWKLQEVVTGTATDRATGSLVYTANAVHVLRVSLAGAAIAGQLDGAGDLSYGSAASGLTATKLGILLYMNGAITNKARVDDFQVYLP